MPMMATTAGAALVSAAAWAAQPTAADSAALATVFQTAAEQYGSYALNLSMIGRVYSEESSGAATL